MADQEKTSQYDSEGRWHGYRKLPHQRPPQCENCGKPMSEHNEMAQCWPLARRDAHLDDFTSEREQHAYTRAEVERLKESLLKIGVMANKGSERDLRSFTALSAIEHEASQALGRIVEGENP